MMGDGGEPVFVGLGSNMADPAQQVGSAIKRLAAEPDIELQRQSGLYSSPPWGELKQADFINAVVQLATGLKPDQLLGLLVDIEREMGRKRLGQRWGPRIMDLDLLAFGQRSINTERLIVPHPRISERAFVLAPFAEIAPDFCLPGLGSIKQLLTLRQDAGTIHRLKNGKQHV